MLQAVMSNVVGIDQTRTFTLAQARELLPIVRRITSAAEEKVRGLGQRYSNVSQPDQKTELEQLIKACIAEWQGKMTRLGVTTKGLWLVDFDNGDGYWCWQHREADISFTHGYHEGFKQRRPLP